MGLLPELRRRPWSSISRRRRSPGGSSGRAASAVAGTCSTGSLAHERGHMLLLPSPTRNGFQAEAEGRAASRRAGHGDENAGLPPGIGLGRPAGRERRERRDRAAERVGDGAEQFALLEGDLAVRADAGRAGGEDPPLERRRGASRPVQCAVELREIQVARRRRRIDPAGPAPGFPASNARPRPTAGRCPTWARTPRTCRTGPGQELGRSRRIPAAGASLEGGQVAEEQPLQRVLEEADLMVGPDQLATPAANASSWSRESRRSAGTAIETRGSRSSAEGTARAAGCSTSRAVPARARLEPLELHGPQRLRIWGPAAAPGQSPGRRRARKRGP